MRPVSRVLFLIVLALCFAASASPQEVLWESLNAKFMELYQQGRHAEAVKFATEALRVAEQTFGPEQPQVGTSLNILAALYRTQGQYALAEPLYKRSLAIAEKALGPEHPNVATLLENLAALYKATERDAEAQKLAARAQKIRANK